MALTDTNYLGLFLLFIAINFAMALVRVKWWIAALVKFLYIMWVIQYIYLGEMLVSVSSIIHLAGNLSSNAPILLSGDWESITDPFRTLLFFLLLWMTTYLIRHWIEVRKSILLFYSMTVIFVAAIDTFSPLSTDSSIFLIMITGLLLLGLLFISKLAERHKTPISTGALLSVSVPLLFVVVVSGLFANVMPKQDPIWPDPVPYVKSFVQGAGKDGSGIGEGVTTSGYGTDDSHLGGSFEQDDTLVFEAQVANKQYWKIETKNTYTTKGWEQLFHNPTETSYSSGMEVSDYAQSDAEVLQSANIQLSLEFPFIVYPYGIHKVNADDNVELLHSESTGKYRTEIDGHSDSLTAYEIEFVAPDYSLKALRSTNMQELQTLDNTFSQYLQLPDALPERVRDLAVSITENQESVYEKAKAIERYFGRSGFVYAQQQIATPEADEDYVDQFLFETKRGYCDNFSTSMVVMLRAIDIPARWVKGFAPGEYRLNDEGERVYQITNNEAHSWVEAYLPGIGWIPFEPTIGFTNLTDIEYDIELAANDPQVQEMNEQNKAEEEQTTTSVAKKKKIDMKSYISAFTLWLKKYIWLILTGILVMAFITWCVYRKRMKWMPKYLLRVHRYNADDWDTFVKRYKSLLKHLERLGLGRSEGMTLNKYAEIVDAHFGGNRMRTLTEAYEEGLYGANTTEHDWVFLKEMWEDLINRTSS